MQASGQVPNHSRRLPNFFEDIRYEILEADHSEQLGSLQWLKWFARSRSLPSPCVLAFLLVVAAKRGVNIAAAKHQHIKVHMRINISHP